MSNNQLSLFDQEIWRWVVGYENLYKVSSLGRVMSCLFSKTKILKPWESSNNYLNVGLSKNKKLTTRLVHNLVAEAFLEPCPGERGARAGCWTVDHIDENCYNNRADNLRWLEHGENISRSRKGKGNPSKLTKSQVILIRQDIRPHRIIAADYGVNAKAIGRVKNYDTWKKV